MVPGDDTERRRADMHLPHPRRPGLGARRALAAGPPAPQASTTMTWVTPAGAVHVPLARYSRSPPISDAAGGSAITALSVGAAAIDPGHAGGAAGPAGPTGPGDAGRT